MENPQTFPRRASGDYRVGSAGNGAVLANSETVSTHLDHLESARDWRDESDLDRRRWGWQVHSSAAAKSEMRAGQILYELDRWDEEEVPEELLLAAVEEKEEITPDLIAAVEDAAKNPATLANDPSHQLYYWAIYLLTQFNATEAFPAVLEFFKLNETEYSHIVSDIIDEDGAMILANLCGGKIEPICEMLHDPKAPEANRAAAAVALGFLCVWGELDLPRVETEYRRALENLDEDSSFLAMELVNGAADLNLRGL